MAKASTQCTSFSSLLQWDDAATARFQDILTTPRGDVIELFQRAVKEEKREKTCTDLSILFSDMFSSGLDKLPINAASNWLVLRRDTNDCHVDVAIVLSTKPFNGNYIPLLLIGVAEMISVERKRVQLHRYSISAIVFRCVLRLCFSLQMLRNSL